MSDDIPGEDVPMPPKDWFDKYRSSVPASELEEDTVDD